MRRYGKRDKGKSMKRGTRAADITDHIVHGEMKARTQKMAIGEGDEGTTTTTATITNTTGGIGQEGTVTLSCAMPMPMPTLV